MELQVAWLMVPGINCSLYLQNGFGQPQWHIGWRYRNCIGLHAACDVVRDKELYKRVREECVQKANVKTWSLPSQVL